MSPILPENRARYPKDWKEIRKRILERARHCCEGVPGHPCGVANYAVVERWTNQRGDRKKVKIILTIAHLDHTPENSNPENLRALCQRCHNRYDAKHRAANRKRRRALAGVRP